MSEWVTSEEVSGWQVWGVIEWGRVREREWEWEWENESESESEGEREGVIDIIV